MSTEASAGGIVRGRTTDTSESWRTLMVGGAVIAALGVLAIVFPYTAGVSLSILLGVLLIVGGAVNLAHAFSATNWKGSLVEVVLAVIYFVAGMALMANPVIGLTTLTLIVIGYLLVDGVFEIGMGLQLRPDANWRWVVVSGALSVVVAGLLLIGFPGTATWAVGLLLGVGLLSSGLSMVLVAMNGRDVARAKAVPPSDVRGA